MDIKEILYLALATIVVMAILQLTTFMVTRMMYPPEPKVVYRDAPMVHSLPTPSPQVAQIQYQAPQAPLFPPPPAKNGPVLTQPQQDIQLPEYEPRQQATTSLRMDPELPPGLQETRPPGT